MLDAIMLDAIMLGVTMLDAIMLEDIMLDVIMELWALATAAKASVKVEVEKSIAEGVTGGCLRKVLITSCGSDDEFGQKVELVNRRRTDSTRAVESMAAGRFKLSGMHKQSVSIRPSRVLYASDG